MSFGAFALFAGYPAATGIGIVMRIAIVKLSALGDIVHAMVALQFIREARPDIEIDWIVERRFAGVLEHNPHIRVVHCVDLKALKQDKTLLFEQLKAILGVRHEHYDLVIDAQGLLKSAIVSRLIGSQCAGFAGDSIREAAAAWFYQHTVHIPYHANTIDRNVAVMTRPLDIQVDEGRIVNKKPFLYYVPPAVDFGAYLKQDQANVLLVVGSTWASRNYPLTHFLQVIYKLDAHCLICWGNEREHWMAQWLAENSLAQVLPRLSLNDLKALISACDLVIGNDTGPTHMAWGAGRPSITLFGPTPVTRIYQTPLHRALKSPSEVDPYKLNKHDFSISEIAPQLVVDTARELLALSRGANAG
jgi:heptosyltransferase I